ncbi:hypothetical protein, partial [Pseudomonas aeruginosa]|uniref:hypothetical protein n=1 Tax=Pseudomonas aeruginosa TaxID=287 RepID=UPI0015CB4942
VCCRKVDCPLYGEDYVAVIHTAPQVEFAFLPWLQQQLGTLRAPQRVVLSHQALPLNGAGHRQAGHTDGAVRQGRDALAERTPMGQQA